MLAAGLHSYYFREQANVFELQSVVDDIASNSFSGEGKPTRDSTTVRGEQCFEVVEQTV